MEQIFLEANLCTTDGGRVIQTQFLLAIGIEGVYWEYKLCIWKK